MIWEIPPIGNLVFFYFQLIICQGKFKSSSTYSAEDVSCGFAAEQSAIPNEKNDPFCKPQLSSDAEHAQHYLVLSDIAAWGVFVCLFVSVYSLF